MTNYGVQLQPEWLVLGPLDLTERYEIDVQPSVLLARALVLSWDIFSASVLHYTSDSGVQETTLPYDYISVSAKFSTRHYADNSSREVWGTSGTKLSEPFRLVLRMDSTAASRKGTVRLGRFLPVWGGYGPLGAL